MKAKLLISLFAVGLLTFNFSFENKENQKKDLTLQNIALMQANAFEVICEGTMEADCTYTIGGITGQSKAPMVVYP